MDEVGDEIGVLVDRLGRLHESAGAFFVQVAHPGGDGRKGNEHVLGRLLKRPAAGGPKLKDGQALSGLIVRPAMARDALHASILQAHLFAEKVKLLAKAVDLIGVAVTSIATPRGPGMGTGQGELGEGDGVEDSGADTLLPLPG